VGGKRRSPNCNRIVTRINSKIKLGLFHILNQSYNSAQLLESKSAALLSIIQKETHVLREILGEITLFKICYTSV